MGLDVKKEIIRDCIRVVAVYSISFGVAIVVVLQLLINVGVF